MLVNEWFIFLLRWAALLFILNTVNIIRKRYRFGEVYSIARNQTIFWCGDPLYKPEYLVLYIHKTVYHFAYMIGPHKLFLFESLVIQGEEVGTVGKRDIKRGVVAVRWDSFLPHPSSDIFPGGTPATLASTRWARGRVR